MHFGTLNHYRAFSGKGRTHRPPGFQSLSGPRLLAEGPVDLATGATGATGVSEATALGSKG